MALNFSQRPKFPAHTSEDNLVSPLRNVNGYAMEGMPVRVEGFVRPQYVNNLGLQDCFCYGRDRDVRGGSSESISKDVIDLLPLDPFDMDYDFSSTFTAITGWLENLEVDYGGHGMNNVGSTKEAYDLYTGCNLFWKSMGFQSFPGDLFDDNSAAVYGGYHYVDWKDISHGLCQVGVSGGKTKDEFCFESGSSSTLSTSLENYSEKIDCSNEDDGALCDVSGGKTEEEFCFDCGSTVTLSTNHEESPEKIGCSNKDGGVPHEAFELALSHLGLTDLINVERVCRSLHSTVCTDPLLWRNVHIDKPLNERITDDVLFRLTNRAQGDLRSLSLVECPRITDDGLDRVLKTNLKLTELFVPGCTRLSIDGIVNILRAFNSATTSRIKYLRIAGLFGVTLEHFEVLKGLLSIDSNVQCKGSKPHYYLRGNLYLLHDDERPIDIEICPKCEKYRLVYDCPAEGCQSLDGSTVVCRACILCICRCVECGQCIKGEYEETFSLELQCSDCMRKIPKGQGKLEMEGGLSLKDDDLGEQSSDCCLHG